MTSPIEQVTVKCPNCGHVYDDWFRASINQTLGERFDEADVRRATAATCPRCGHVVEFDALIVDGDGVWHV